MSPRTLAVEGLLAVTERGLSLDTVLADPRLAELSAEDRSLASAMIYGVLRHRLLLDGLVQRYLQKPLKKRDGGVKLTLRWASSSWAGCGSRPMQRSTRPLPRYRRAGPGAW